ncbi:hypothetical protein HJFPF1_08232 [Paramyrothecium foliicola]|nr:hypothetical protein HJFPF1_08232 [Paramyrothecium foliicola]
MMMGNSQPGGISFLHLPPEIRSQIYDLAFTPPAYSNLLDPRDKGYTKDTQPLLYVHPLVTGDLRARLYRDDFSIVLPIQDPSEVVRGRGLDDEALRTALAQMSPLIRKNCKNIIVELSQTFQVFEEWESDCGEDRDTWEASEDYEIWNDDTLAQKLIPWLLQIKKAMPALHSVKFIFWMCEDYLAAPLDAWERQLHILAEEWYSSTDENMADLTDEGVDTEKPVLDVVIQVNVFDFYDQDAGDGGKNWIQVWDDFANKERSGSGLIIQFSAIDLQWADHINGKFEGREFDPSGWEDEYILLMDDREADNLLHVSPFPTGTYRPLFVKTRTDAKDNNEDNEDASDKDE